jgi:uncharacterized protein (DUF2252 family)
VAQAVLQSLSEYSETLPPARRHFFELFHSVDVGFKVVGTGSVGLRDYIVLFEGNGPGDPMLSAQNDNVLIVQSRNVLLTPFRLGRCKKDNY